MFVDVTWKNFVTNQSIHVTFYHESRSSYVENVQKKDKKITHNPITKESLLLIYLQYFAYLRDITGSTPDHYDKTSITVKQVIIFLLLVVGGFALNL